MASFATPLDLSHLQEIVSRFETNGKKIVIFCENPDPKSAAETPELFKISSNADNDFVSRAEAAVPGGIAQVKKILQKNGRLVFGA
jgi:hypothetical protein